MLTVRFISQMKALRVYIVKHGNMANPLVFVLCLHFTIDGDRFAPTRKQDDVAFQPATGFNKILK